MSVLDMFMTSPLSEAHTPKDGQRQRDLCTRRNLKKETFETLARIDPPNLLKEYRWTNEILRVYR